MKNLKILKNILDNKKISLIQTDELDLEIHKYNIDYSKYYITISSEIFYISISEIKNIKINDNYIIVYYEKSKKIKINF